MRKYRLSHRARKDLDKIWLNIARDSIESANRFLESLTERFPLLADSPRMGRLREDLQPDLRSFPVKSYLIFYRPLGKRGVGIVRVVHGARNLRSLFPKD